MNRLDLITALAGLEGATASSEVYATDQWGTELLPITGVRVDDDGCVILDVEVPTDEPEPAEPPVRPAYPF